MRFDRVPPQDVDAERAVLGGMLIATSAEAIPNVMEILGSDPNKSVFYRESHQKIYNAILNLFEKNEPADLITLTKELGRTGDLEKIGVAYLDEMIDSTPNAANIEHYAKIVKDESTRREIISTSVDVYNSGFDAEESVEDILDDAERKMLDIRRTDHTDFMEQSEPIKLALKEINEGNTGIPTGFKDIDRMLLGIMPEDYVVVAARPGTGKTMFVMNIARNIAGNLKMPVGIFTIEMTPQALMKRMLASECGMSHRTLRTGNLTESQWHTLTIKANEMNKFPMIFDHTPGLNERQLSAKVRRMKSKYGIGLIIVDHLQLMRHTGRQESKRIETGNLSKAFKRVASENKTPIMVVSQLSRAPESRTDSRPILSDLRESGEIEQDADTVLFIYRDELYNKDTDDKGIAEIIMAKQRNGETGVAKLSYSGDLMRFGNLERRFK